jgi:hypothetical protein
MADLYYPKILTDRKNLNIDEVEKAIRRLFDMVYKLRIDLANIDDDDSGGGATLPIDLTTDVTGLLPAANLGPHKTTHQNGGTDELNVGGLNGLLADAQTPLAHKTSHQSGGSDAIKLDDLATPDDNTDLNVSTSAHGLMSKLPGGTTTFYRADGTFATPSGAGDVVGPASSVEKEIALFDGTTGKLLERATGTGIVRVTSGVYGTPGNVDLTTEVTGDLPFANLVQASGASKLVGRGSASGAGDFQEVTLGANLTMTGTVLSASGGSGGGSIYPDFVAPVNGDFSWINQGGASVTVNANGGIFLRAPATSGVAIRLRQKAVPTAPYVVTTAFVPALLSNTVPTVGIALRQSSDGKIIVFGLVGNGGSYLIQILKYTDASTYSGAAYLSTSFDAPGLVYFRFTDDNTNRICSYSTDGYNFIQLHSVGRTDYMTPDNVGFMANEQTNLFDCGLTLMSWEEA